MSKAPPFKAKLSVPVLVKSPGLPETPVNAKGLPDKVKEVAPAKEPVPLKASPLSGPATVMVRLVLPPEKVIVPVVGADKVTPESDALTVIALSAIARIMTAEEKDCLPHLRDHLGSPGRSFERHSPHFLTRRDFSSHTTVVNSTSVLKPDFCSIYQPRRRRDLPRIEIGNGHQFAWASAC